MGLQMRVRERRRELFTRACSLTGQGHKQGD
jgi:hypothetical protein